MRNISMILILTLAGCGSGPVTLNSSQMKTVQLAGTLSVSDMQQDFIGCSALDSEPDGYVTCTMKDRSNTKISQMLCSYQGDTGGCKMK
jgi:hypothetical protein